MMDTSDSNSQDTTSQDTASQSTTSQSTPSPGPSSTESAAPKKDRKRRRWLRRLIAVVVGLLLVIVAIQAVLWSSIPKSLVLSALQKALGVKVEADSVTTGWWGSTRVENVAMTIPLEEEPFVKTGTIRVKHSSLIELVIFGLEIESLDIDSPSVFLRQSPSGRWNVVDLAQSFAASNAGGGGGAAGPSERPQIPAIKIHDAIVQVSDNTGKTSQVGPVQISGTPGATAPGLVWEYQIVLPEQLTVDGRVALGGDWRNEAKINVQNIKPLLSPFVGAPPDVKLAARWEGSAAGGVQGRLSVERLSIKTSDQATSEVAFKGAVGLSTVNGKVTVSPENFEWLDGEQKARAAVVGGQIVYDTGNLHLDTLLIRGPGIDASVNASLALATQTGELSLNWRGTAFPSGINHAGVLTAKLDKTFDGRVEATAALDTNGQMTANTARNWSGRIEVSAAGETFNELAVTVQAKNFKFVGPRRTVDLDGLVAKLKVSEDLDDNEPGGMLQNSSPGLGVSLSSLRLRDTNRYSADGFFLTGTQQWALAFKGDELPIPKISPDALGVALEMAGNPEMVKLRSVKLAVGGTLITGSGSFEFDKPEPLFVKVDIAHSPPTTDIEAQQLGAEETTPPLLSGRLAADGQIQGTVDPLNLKIGGQVQGIGVKLLGRDLGDMSIAIAGYADKYRAQVWRDSEKAPLSILGANWEFEAFHDLDKEATTLTIGFKDMPLKEVGDLIDDPTLSGTASGDWAIYVPMYGDITSQIRAGGKLEAKNIRIRGFELDSLEAWTEVQDGRAGFSPVRVRLDNGVFTAKPSVPLKDLTSVEIADLRLQDWPLALPPSTYLTVDASAPYVAAKLGQAKPQPANPADTPLAPGLTFQSGPISVQTKVTIGDVDVGDVRLNAVLDNRSVNVTLLSAKLFDSDVTAKATANLDQPNATTASFMVTGVNTGQIRKLIPDLEAVSGSFDISGAVGPISGPDALEPMALEAALTSRNVVFRPPTEGGAPSPGIQIGDGRFQVQMRLDSQFQLARAVLSDQSGITQPSVECPPRRDGPLAVNTLEAAGGILSFWGRAVRNTNDRNQPGLTTLSSHFRVGFRCLDVNQILQAFKPDDEPTPGRIDGSIVLYGTTGLVRKPVVRGDVDQEADLTLKDPIQPATDPIASTEPTTMPIAPDLQVVEGDDAESFLTSLMLAMQGEGQFKIYDSDLGNIDAIAFLYNAMRLGQGAAEPTGKGDLSFRFENGDVYLDGFRYFNRGVDVKAVGTIFNLQKLQKAPIRATAYGSVRTLAGVEIPIVRSILPDIDEIISGLQQGGTSIAIDGTLGKTKMRVVLFEDLGEGMRELLIGDVKAQQKPR